MRIEPTEEQINATIRQGLGALGYVVLSTSVRGWNRNKGYGASKGVPDLLVSRKGWGCWLGLEVKNAKGRVRPEQQELADQGLLSIVRSWEEALAVVASFEAQMGFKEVAGRVS